MKWIIERGISDAQTRLENSLRKFNVDFDVTDYIPHDDVSYIPIQPKNTIFYGSLNLADKLRRREDMAGGTFCKLEEFECVKYYPGLAKYLLNADNYSVIEFSDLLNQKDELFAKYPNDFFVRPSSGKKIFTGAVLSDTDQYEANVEFLGFYDVEPDSVCIVAPPKNISAEFRFSVIDGVVVTGCQYGEPDETIYSDHAAYQYAQEVANYMRSNELEPEIAYVIDVALSNETYYVLELNAFSSSGLYSLDTDAIVSAIKKLILKNG